MNKKVEKFILRHRPLCEMPDKTGAPRCKNDATRILPMRGRRGVLWTVAACPDCASYAEAEGKLLSKRESQDRTGSSKDPLKPANTCTGTAFSLPKEN